MDGDTILSFYLVFIVQRKWTNGTTNFGARNEAHNVSGKFFFIKNKKITTFSNNTNLKRV